VKEYLSRGTYIFPPEPSLRLTVDMIAYTVRHMPKWNPINVCSYHLQEAGATPVQEIAYALATAIACWTACGVGKVRDDELATVVGRISFFVNSGGALRRRDVQDARLHADVGPDLRRALRRHRPEAPPLPLRRQVNSLGLTEQQPENNVPRIVLETLGVTLSADARRRAIQLPRVERSARPAAPWTSSGRCESNRSWPSSRTCSTTATSSPARR